MSPATSDLKDLLETARDDGPSAGQQRAVWDRVAAATGAAAGAATAGSAASAAKGLFGAKLLALGGLLGAVGGALAVLAVTMAAPGEAATPEGVSVDGVRPAPTLAEGPRRIRRVAAPRMPGLRLADSVWRSRAPLAAQPRVAAEATVAPRAAAAVRDDATDLAEEARLVTEARAALVAGEAARALTLVRATRHLHARALEPEELGLEARALHALGRVDEAAEVDLLLRRRFPDHALAR